MRKMKINNNKFSYCCGNASIKEYTLSHCVSNFSKEQINTILTLLWYVPNIDSAQSIKNDIITNTLYEDLCEEWFTKITGITRSDIQVVNKINEKDIFFYKDQVCVSCQKIVITPYKKKTFVESVLCHIRNIIAHGRFNFVDKVLIGFDYNAKKDEKNCTAIIKLNPDKVLKALKELNSVQFSVEILRFAFKRLGYTILSPKNKTHEFDLCVKKANKSYCFEFKNFNKRFLHKVDYQGIIFQLKQEVPEKYITVLVMDKTILTKDTLGEILKRNIYILDKKSIENLSAGIDPIQLLEKNMVKRN